MNTVRTIAFDKLVIEVEIIAYRYDDNEAVFVAALESMIRTIKILGWSNEHLIDVLDNALINVRDHRDVIENKINALSVEAIMNNHLFHQEHIK